MGLHDPRITQIASRLAYQYTLRSLLSSSLLVLTKGFGQNFRLAVIWPET